MKFIRRILEFIRAIRILKRKPVSQEFRKRIIQDYRRTIFFRRSRSMNNSLRLLGYKVYYCLYDAYCYVFNDIFINQEYFFTTSNPTPKIIDCGSNIGLSVIYFKCLYPQASITAFEPDPDAFSCLEKNISENRITDVEIHNKALSGETGSIRFHYNPERPGAITSSTENKTLDAYRDVDAVKLSDYIKDSVDFLKMDIEGAETDVFHELHKSNTLQFINQIILEYHHHIGNKPDRLSEILTLLEQNGFGYRLGADTPDYAATSAPQLIMIYAYKK